MPVLNTKSLIASIIFLLAGLLSSIFFVSNWQTSLPNFIFYIILIINTYFSVSLFSNLIPANNIQQKFFDLLIFFIYLALAININGTTFFAFFGALLFTTSVIKYNRLLMEINYTSLLKRKMFLNTLGALGFLLVLGSSLIGYGVSAMWMLTLAFFIINLYLFFIKPLYWPIPNNKE